MSGCQDKFVRIFRVALALAVFFFLPALAFSQVSTPPVPYPASQVPPSITRPDIGFATPQKLHDHFQKHGKEFGKISKEEYLRRAQELRDRWAGGEVLEAIRKDGIITRFDRKSGAFLACNPDGTIRTFFRPNDGESYFRRQARRNPNR
jgi:pyocin large subunit-like protein